jgi:hypothetical protein
MLYKIALGAGTGEAPDELPAETRRRLQEVFEKIGGSSKCKAKEV